MDIDFEPYRSIVMRITDIMIDSKRAGFDFRDRRKTTSVIFDYLSISECYLKLHLRCFDKDYNCPTICLFDRVQISSFPIYHVCKSNRTFENNELLFRFYKRKLGSNFTEYITSHVSLEFTNPFELKTYELKRSEMDIIHLKFEI
ncbi:hypothetical protein RF11_02937 [Thelohanellus kitauei]|uniref:Uncharacterized protein n=1 Tax=Thelohanellus kitauei TaxID=669202 RepID=A0A0C2NG26_THEKT|nr:hypothetical protein RF11_02937 [Thelohanellus kitauei]